MITLRGLTGGGGEPMVDWYKLVLLSHEHSSSYSLPSEVTK